MRLIAVTAALTALSLWVGPSAAGARDGASRAAKNAALPTSLRDIVVPSPAPEGVGIRMTDVGPVFTDQTQMTLYLRASGLDCYSKNGASGADLHPLLNIYAEYKAPTCVDQWPPFLAPADAKPIGNWTVIDSPVGSRQWAYKGAAVHLSRKDRLPGDVNGPNSGSVKMLPALVPLRMPAGVQTTETPFGVTGAIAAGLLYVLPAAIKPDEKWLSFAAGALARPIKGWSIIDQGGGDRVWAFRNRPVYTFAGDHETGDMNGIGIDGAQLVVFAPAPPAPPEITMQRAWSGPVYADLTGLSIYTFKCTMPAPGTRKQETFFCDNWDSPVGHREMFCAAPDRCGERFRPILAPADRKPVGGRWSVATIPDPVRYPLRWIPAGTEADEKPGAVKVITYKGSPVYGWTEDEVPGEMWGNGIVHGGAVQWNVIYAGRF